MADANVSNEGANAAANTNAALQDPMADPYYLHGSEQPGQLLVAEKLTTTNYNDWNKAMYNALGAKNKTGFINGTLVEPAPDSPQAWSWNRNNIMVLSWIQQAVEPGIRKTIMSFKSAAEAWRSLRARYGQGDMVRIAELIEALATMKQGNQTLTEYYGEMIVVRDELDNYQPLDPCDCTPTSHSTCRAMKQVLGYRDTGYVIQFLRGLNENYSTVRSQVLFQDTLPSIDRVFQRMLQHERQQYGSHQAKALVAESTAFASHSNIPANKRTKPYCTYCKALGHTEDVCFHKHGWPPGMTPRGVTAAGKPVECNYCKKLGHTEDKCYQKNGYPPGTGRGRGRPQVNAATTVIGDKGQQEVKLTKAEYEKFIQMMSQSTQASPGPSFSAAVFTTSKAETSGKYVFNAQNKDPYNQLWILDTGASDHIVCSLSLLQNHKQISGVFITLPTGQRVEASHSGTVRCLPDLVLEEALYVPQFNFNLVSVSKLSKNKSLCLTFFSDVCLIQDMQLRRMTGSAKLSHGLYLLDNIDNSIIPKHTTATSSAPFDLWHHRLGHVSHSKIPLLRNLCTSIETYSSIPCDVCHFARQKRLPFPSSSSVTENPFQLIHTDIWGPHPVPSYDGHRYFLTIVDDFSRMTWIILLQTKAEARPKLKEFCNYIERQFDTSVKKIRSDQGKEFRMSDFFQNTGIFHEQSCVETPEQNSKVERKHQHILAVARALKFQANLPSGFWADCVKHAVHLINRVPTPVLNNLTPFEKLHKKPPDLSYLRVFGCLCFASTLHNHRTKFDSRARKGIFIGFTSGIKGYKIYDLTSHEVFTSRDVQFHENHFPFHHEVTSNLPSDLYNSSLTPAPFDDPSPSYQPTTNPSHTLNDLNTLHFDSDSDTDNYTTSPTPTQHSPPTPSPPPPPPPPPPVPTRKSTRTPKPPSHLQLYHCNLLQQFSSTSHPTQQHNPGITHSLNKVIHYDNLSPTDRHFALSISSYKEPESYKEAILSPFWDAAMQDEFQALDRNQTWDIVEAPPNVKLIGNKWIYKFKFLSDGSLERRKARLVAKGYTQQEGIDYQDTFAPVVKMTTIRLFLALASIHNWHIHQLDINNAFLHGDLEECVYMKLPDGYKQPAGIKNPVCKLKKSLYGLKQASRQWFSKLAEKLQSQGFTSSKVDHSMFYKATSTSYTCILVYVDDLVIGGNDLSDIINIKAYLHQEFSIKDLGDLKFFLGIEVSRSPSGIHISQRKYTLEILDDAAMINTKPVTTPIDYKTHLSAQHDDPYPDPEQYRRLVGKLIYLTTTRPDISFATQQVSHFMSNPSHTHFKAVNRILRYLKSAPSNGLFFPSSSTLHLKAFSDSDWAACVDTRRSVTGYCVYLGDSLVSWKCKKQTTISRSSCEAEYRALAYTTCEVQWLLYLLHDFKISHPQPASIYCDNQSAIYIAENPTFHERTKHIELDCHFVREKLHDGTIKVLHVSTVHQLADIFTKALSPAIFHNLLSKLGVHELCPPACGGLSEKNSNSSQTRLPDDGVPLCHHNDAASTTDRTHHHNDDVPLTQAKPSRTWSDIVSGRNKGG
ncbi:unnamed protein product [Linum trigynum]|uniref:Integrase catalytic domain-containing protein n=1 Tax=Linum trigynum TaxID=586398 RepID=A0AAV2FJ73_9ROSI